MRLARRFWKVSVEENVLQFYRDVEKLAKYVVDCLGKTVCYMFVD